MNSYFEIFAPPPSVGVGANKKYQFSRQFVKCLTFEFLPMKFPTPGGVGLIFFITFLGSS